MSTGFVAACLAKYALECPPYKLLCVAVACSNLRPPEIVSLTSIQRVECPKFNRPSHLVVVRARSPVASLHRPSSSSPVILRVSRHSESNHGVDGLGQKKLHPFCFCSNFVKLHYILIIFRFRTQILHHFCAVWRSCRNSKSLPRGIGRNRDSGLIAGYRRLLDVRSAKNIYRRRS